MPATPPLQKGLYADVDGAPRLIASRCDPCDRVFFPRRQYCGRCSSSAMRDLPLSARGTLHAWSLIDRKPKVAVIEPPYLQADVAMPEGVHVFTVLRGCEPTQVHIGMPVEIYVDTVPAPDGEGERSVYLFRPVAGEGAAA